ncbi:hypothetical protein D1BOALGB6SA_1749 [Olavius sp. associated proteobacterium Delta 1]|nr:hypothetical protein D1BOALGB6SA_1749 [Olavius sp. associated proteobacterium Delta 1]
MLASQSIATGEDARPMNDFVGSQQFPDNDRFENFPFMPCDFKEANSWAEQKYQAGEFTALVAIFDNIPPDLKNSLEQLVAVGYCKNLFLSNFFEASLLLLSSGTLTSLKSLAEASKELYAEYCSTTERKRACDFVSCRNPDDIVVLVLKSGTLVGSMTLYPFNNRENMPSLSYLNLGAAQNRLLNVPALEVGRLAKAATLDDHAENSSSGLLKTVWIAAAFLVARDFVKDNGLLYHPKSYVCGDTYGSLIASLKHFFPIETVPSSLRADILEENSVARHVAIYFLQRQVLGSFESADDFIEAINEISNCNPKIAHRILELMEAGLKKMGITSLQKFDAQKFKIDFFYFPLHHEQTIKGLNRLEKVILKLSAHRSMRLH